MKISKCCKEKVWECKDGYVCQKCNQHCDTIDQKELQRADDIIGHDVSGTESIQMKDEVKEDWVEEYKNELLPHWCVGFVAKVMTETKIRKTGVDMSDLTKILKDKFTQQKEQYSDLTQKEKDKLHSNCCEGTNKEQAKMVEAYERGFIDGANLTGSQALEELEEQKQEILEEYNKFLIKNGYADDDLWNEEPSAIDRFLKERKE